jgi:uncharacterized metal-binding protein YceD (DUF177 family)
MSGRRIYDIPHIGLKPGDHSFQFEITDQFFTEYDQQDFSNCNAVINVTLEKNTGFMQLKFDIGGTLDVICDRCGNTVPLQLWDEFKILVKIVDDAEKMNEEEEDPDIFYIDRSESYIHLSDWFYEFINLSIPSTRICADKPSGESGCNQEVLAKLKGMQPEEHNANTLWKGLDKIKGLK